MPYKLYNFTVQHRETVFLSHIFWGCCQSGSNSSVFLLLLMAFCSGSCSVVLCIFLLPRLWQTLRLELVPELCPLLIKDVTHHEETVRVAVAEALSSAVSQYKEESATVLSQLTELYQQKLYVSLSLCKSCLKIIQSITVHLMFLPFFLCDRVCNLVSICEFIHVSMHFVGAISQEWVVEWF